MMGTVLQRVSLYLAGLTGLDADSWFFGLLFGLAATVAGIVFCVLADLPAWWQSLLRVPPSFEKAQAPRKLPAPVFWAGRWFPDDQQRYHFAICGTTRSGKSLLLSLFLRSVISQITPGSNRRLILFDPKNELHPALFENAQVPVYFMLPSDLRSSRWDLARDFTSPAGVVELCNALAPVPPGDNNPFFAKAIQGLLGGVISSLNRTQPGEWDLADVVRILEQKDFTAQVLARTDQTSSKQRFMAEPRTWSSIEATLETHLEALRIIAAFWSRARQTFSLAEFVQGEGILIVGRDPRYAALLDPLNMLLLTQLFSQLLAQGDSTTRRTHLVIDELTVAAGEEKALPGLKDIAERGASRGVVVTVAYQSYADVKALYKDAGDAVLGMLQHRVFLRAGDVPTAEFASKSFGQTQKWEEARSTTTSPQGGSTTTSGQWLVRDVVPYKEFLDLRPASPQCGISGYWQSPAFPDAKELSFHLPGWWIEDNRPKCGGAVEPYLMRPDYEQWLEPLSYADLQRLGLRLSDGGKDDAGAALPLASPKSAALPPPPAEDDITGRLRRLAGSVRYFDEDEHDDDDDDEGDDDAPTA